VYPTWKPDVEYKAGDRVLYNNILYKVVTTHTSQNDWAPIIAPSLFAKVLIPDDNVIPAWEQPDSTNAYATGDKVTHNGKTWISNVDNNVWEPGAYGWSEI
jgi:chitodextrinase